jgi:adenine/guanine/hypoxanthine permease
MMAVMTDVGRLDLACDDMSAEEPTTELFVNGTLMQGLALHANLGDATFLGETRTAPSYRLHSIDDVHPGMYWAADGSSIAGELYAVTAQQRAHILATEPPGLYFGPVELADGRTTEGVLFPADEARRYPDITAFGGWRAYQSAIHGRAAQ